MEESGLHPHQRRRRYGGRPADDPVWNPDDYGGSLRDLFNEEEIEESSTHGLRRPWLAFGPAPPPEAMEESGLLPRQRRRASGGRQAVRDLFDEAEIVDSRTHGLRRHGIGTRSQASSSSAPRSYSVHPGAEVGTRLRPSFLYSDRPRRSLPRRQTPALLRAEEHPAMVSSSELGRVVADLPTFEALSLSDPPLLTPQTADTDETDDDEVSPEPVGFGYGTLGPQTLRYSARPPRPKWFGGVRGQTMLEENAGDASSSELDPITDSSRSEELSATVSSLSRSEKPTEDPDDDTEEELRLLQEYFDANPPTSISQAFDEIEAANHAAFVSLAAEWGIKPPPPLPPRRQFLADQAQQKASAAVAHPQHSTVPRKPRREASTEEIVENAKKWMREEVTVVFQDYVGTRDDLKIVDYRLDELCHQCVSVENYHNVFHHYNFTMKLKKANSDDWIGALYFAEVKQMFGRKSYFCCPLEPNENGLCYACQDQGVDDLRHPATGGFDKGLPGIGFGLWYSDE